MKFLKNKNKLTFVVSLIGLSLFLYASLPASIHAAPKSKPPIPIGCPGSKIQGPASSKDLAKCDTIPVGCPGTTKSGPVSPGFDTNTCPYAGAVSSGTDTDSGNLPAACSSQVTDENAKCEVAQECSNGDLSEDNCGITRYLRIFINLLSGLVGITVVGVLIVGGIQYSTSAGDPQAAAAARKRISNAVLALVAFGMMYGFLQWIVPGGVL